MHNDAMTDGNAFADQHGLTWIGMNDAVILDIGLLADGDPFIVTAQYRAKPDAGAGCETYLANHHRIRRDKASLRDFRRDTIKCVNRHIEFLNDCSRENFTH